MKNTSMSVIYFLLQVLVGSSMGGWLSLLVAMERPDRVAAIVGIATAADFADRMYKRLEPKVCSTVASFT